MTHEISGDANMPSDKAAQDFSALTDQWFDKNWYLPPEGDQSWREREARRLFGDGKTDVGEDDPPAVEQPGPVVDEVPYESGLHRVKARHIVLPVSLMACALLAVGAVLAPKILTPGILGPQEPKLVSIVPARLTAQAVAEENVRLRPVYEGSSDHVTYNNVSQALPQPIGEAAVPANQGIALPLPRPSAATKQDAPEPAVRVAKEQPLAAPVSKKRAAKTLPPIGEAYFASHAPAPGKPIGISTRPIGQAYFESHAPVAD